MITFEQFLVGVPLRMFLYGKPFTEVKYVSKAPYAGVFEVTDCSTGKMEMHSLIVELRGDVSRAAEIKYLRAYYEDAKKFSK